MPELLSHITFGGKEVLDPQYLIDQVDENGIDIDISQVDKANSFRLPRGDAVGRGWVLLLKKDLDELDLDLYTHSLVMTAGTEVITIQNLAVLNAEAIGGLDITTDETPYLVEIVDRRAVAQYTSINAAYNFPTPDYNSTSFFTRTKDSGSEWTWATMIQNIWGSMPASWGVLTDGGSYPPSNPEGYDFQAWNAWDALMRVLKDTDNEIIVSITGAFSIVAKGATDSGLAALITSALPDIQETSLDESGDVVTLPEKVRVYFAKKDHAFQGTTDNAEITGKVFQRNIAFISKDTTTTTILSGVTTVPGTISILHDSLIAAFNELGTAQNDAELVTQGTDRATNYLNGLNSDHSRKHNVYSGYKAFATGAQVSGIAWYDNGGGPLTEIVLAPKLFFPEEGLGMLSSTSMRTLSDTFPGPGDFARQHIDSGYIAVGETQSAIVAGGKGLMDVQFGTVGATISWADTTSTHQITVHNISAHRVPITTRQIALWHEQTKEWILSPTGSSAIQYGKAKTNWVDKSASPECDVVDVYFSNDCEGSVIDDTITLGVSFPNYRGGGPGNNLQRPNVLKDDIIAFHLGEDGRYATTGYMDHNIGSVRIWETNFPSTGEGYEWISEMASRFPRQTGQEGDKSGTGGADTAVIQAHTQAEVIAAIAIDNHTGVTGGTKLTMADHPEHYHQVLTGGGGAALGDTTGTGTAGTLSNECNNTDGPIINEDSQCVGLTLTHKVSPETHTHSVTGLSHVIVAGAAALAHIGSPINTVPKWYSLNFFRRIDNSAP